MVPELVTISDIRGLDRKFTLDTAGFQLARMNVDMATLYNNFRDPMWIQSTYYQLVEAMLRDILGPSRLEHVYIYDHTVRRRDPTRPPGSRGTDGALQPVPGVHVDHTIDSGPVRVRQHIEEPRATELMKNRFQIINVWQPLFGPIVDWPLALCDATTVKEGEFIETDLVYPHYYGEIYSLTASPEYKWYFLRDQTPQEVWIFKNFDSEKGCPAKFTPHCGFRNLEATEDARPRESVEFRVLVFYKS